MKNLLLTGGCGFIGSNFIRYFLKTHHEWRVFNFDCLTYAGNPANTADFERHERYEFIRGDICDPKTVDGAMRNADAVINFAAESHVDRSIEDPDRFLLTNILGLRVLLASAMQYRVPRFIHVSTDEVYGSLLKGAAEEEAVLEPNSPYSASKASADLIARAYWKTYQFPVMIVRSSNNFGPYQFPEKVIPLFITNLMEGKKVPLYGTGKNRRQWIYVEDNCRAISLVFDKGGPGEVYNIGAGNEMSNEELTRKILKEMGCGDDAISYVQDRLGHDFRYSIDTSKIQKLGFKPSWTFERGLKETIQWYKQHQDWWLPLKRDKFTVK